MKVDGQQSETNVVECDDVKMPKRSKKENCHKETDKWSDCSQRIRQGKEGPRLGGPQIVVRVWLKNE